MDEAAREQAIMFLNKNRIKTIDDLEKFINENESKWTELTNNKFDELNLQCLIKERSKIKKERYSSSLSGGRRTNKRRSNRKSKKYKSQENTENTETNLNKND